MTYFCEDPHWTVHVGPVVKLLVFLLIITSDHTRVDRHHARNARLLRSSSSCFVLRMSCKMPGCWRVARARGYSCVHVLRGSDHCSTMSLLLRCVLTAVALPPAISGVPPGKVFGVSPGRTGTDSMKLALVLPRHHCLLHVRGGRVARPVHCPAHGVAVSARHAALADTAVCHDRTADTHGVCPLSHPRRSLDSDRPIT